MDVDLSDALTIGIETKLMLNYPRPRTAIMPVALAVSVVRFSGTLSVSFVPSPPTSATPNPSSSPPPPPSASAPQAPSYNASKSRFANNNQKHHENDIKQEPPPTTPPTLLTFSFSPNYRLELSTHSLLGSRSRLQDVPKIAQLVEARLHAWFDERCVSPRVQQVVLPSLWPRARNTRGGGGGGHARGRSSEDSGGPGGEEEAVVGDLDVDVDTPHEDGMVGVEAGEQLPLPRRRRREGKNSAPADGAAGPHDRDSLGGMSPQQGRSTSSSYYRMPGSMPDM